MLKLETITLIIFIYLKYLLHIYYIYTCNQTWSNKSFIGTGKKNYSLKHNGKVDKWHKFGDP
jgi:hypothetical protein